MKRWLFVLIFGALVFLPGCSPPKGQPGPGGFSPNFKEVQATKARTFDPVTITLDRGQSVRWSNTTGIQHNVTFENGPAFNEALDPGKNITRTFTTSGEYDYFCSIHGKRMHGTVLVV